MTFNTPSVADAARAIRRWPFGRPKAGPWSVATAAEAVGGAIPWWVYAGPAGFFLSLVLAYAANIVFWPVAIDQGEGFVLHDAMRIVAGVPLYTSNEEYPFYSSNYPPGFPWLLSLIAPWTGLELWVGRLISVIAAGLSAVLIGLVVANRAGSERWFAGCLAGMIFLASPYVVGLAPLFKADLPALALTLAAFALVSTSADAQVRPWRVAAIAGLLVAAVWIKPNSIAGAAATIGWLIWRNPRLGLGAGAACVALSSGILWWVDRRNHGYFLTNLLAGNFTEWQWADAPEMLLRLVLTNLPLFALLGVALWRGRAVAAARPALLLVGCGGAIALLVGIWGAGGSYFIYLLAGLAIVAGLVWRHAGVGQGRGIASLLILAQLALSVQIPSVYGGLADLRHPTAGRLPATSDLLAARDIVAWLRESGGPVFVENGFFALQAGHDVVGNPTTLVGLESSGKWRGDALVQLFEARQFQTVVIGPHMLPERVLTAIRANYSVIDSHVTHGIRYLVAKPRSFKPESVAATTPSTSE